MRARKKGKGIALFLLLLVLLLIASFAAGRFQVFRKGGLRLSEPKIAVIPIEGVLADARNVLEQIDQYSDRDDVKAFVFRIDSPGGTVVAAQELYAAIRKLKGRKITLSSLGNVAASGGYYVASATDEILANPGTITGSIGVLSQYANLEDLLKKVGLRSTVLKSGRFKDVGSPLRQMTAEEAEYLQGLLDNIHKQFIRDVAQGRDKPIEQIEALSDGRVFTGEQARENGLVDRLGTFQDALDRAAELAGIEGKPVILYPEKKKIRLLDFLMQGLASWLQDFLAAKIGLPDPGGSRL